jgi:hypothetical protein
LTEFTHEEYRSVRVRDVIRVELDDFIVMMSATESSLAYWADGVLFACYAMTESEELAKNEIAGTTYIDKVIFAKYPAFSRTVKSATNFEIPVVNVGRSGMYYKLIAWLKGLPAWND